MRFPEPKLFKPKNPSKYIGDANKIVCRSNLEFRYMKYFDETDSILKYASEEIAIPYLSPVDKRMHRYFPDFVIQVLQKNGEKKAFMVEIKPASQCVQPEQKGKRKKTFLTEAITWEINIAKWKAAEKYCQKNGMEFIVLTEKHIKLKW